MSNVPTIDMPVRTHTGVYGIHIKDEKVLLILKSRGPYKGMYDLPGGGIEKGEANEVALRREYQEEIGCEITSQKILYTDQFEFTYISQSQGEVCFQHIGHFFKVSLPEEAIVKTTPDGHDSMGAIYIDIDDVRTSKVMVAPMAKKAILSVVV